MAHLIDSPDAVAVLPTPLAPGTPGHFGTGTTVRHDWLNAVSIELATMAQMKGASLSKVNNGQCATAVDAVLGMEAKSAEAAGVDTVRKLVVIASDDAEVGKTTAGVVHAAVIASNNSAAVGFETAAIASKDSRAGATDGSTIVAAVIASNKSRAEGDNSAMLACNMSDDDPGATGANCALVACGGDGAGECGGTGNGALAAYNPVVNGSYSAAIASDGPIVPGTNCAALASDSGSTVDGVASVVVAGTGCEVGATGSASGVFASKNIKVNAAQAAAIAATGDATSDEVTGTNALIAATSGSKASGAQSAVLGGSLNEANDTGCVVVASAYSKANSAGNNFVAILASRGYESDVGTDAPAYSLAGGYDGGGPPTPTGRSWAIESNGGNMRSTNAHTTTGLDYAEWFPNGDQIAHGPGLILARRGRTARVAQPHDRILGVVSVAPTVVGGDDSLGWNGRWLRDEWGAYVLAEDAAGNVSRVVNPDFDATQRHSPRSARPYEHTCVGLLGQLRVRVDATVEPDDEVIAGVGGVGTRGGWVGRGAQLECMEIVSPYDAKRGYAIALCLLR
jgi:hypothetical protein